MGDGHTDQCIKYWSMTYHFMAVASIFSKSDANLILENFSFSRRDLSQPGMVPVITIELKSVAPFALHSFVSGPGTSKSNFIYFLDGVLYELNHKYQGCHYYRKFMPTPVLYKGEIISTDRILREMAVPRAIEIFNTAIGI